VGYMPQTAFMNRFRLGLPTIFLFVVLLILPGRRLRAGRSVGRRVPRVPSLRTSLMAAGALIAVVAVLASSLSIDNQIHLGEALAFGFIMLSMVLLTGYGGHVSLCQLTFVGLGAFMAGKVGATPLGFCTAIAVAAAVGALVALPALRLQGLYLALATLAFARFMDTIFFNDPKVFGFGGRLRVG